MATKGGAAQARVWWRDPWVFAFAACVGLLTVDLLVAHALRSYNSDDVALQTILGQWQRGFHRTAHLGADTFVLKIPLYLAVDALVHNGRTALLVTALLLNLTGFAVYFASIRFFVARFGIERPHLVLWPLVWFAGLGLFVTNALITPNLRNVEIGLAFLLTVLVAKSWDSELPHSPAWLVVAVPLIGLFLYNDPYFLFVWVLPLIGLLAASAAVRRSDRRALGTAGVLLGGIIAYKVLDVLGQAAGIQPEAADTSLANLEAIRHHFRLLVHGGLRLFEADLISNPPSLSRPRHLLNLAVLLCALLYPLALWRRRIGFRDQPWPWFFGIQPLVVAGVFVFSNQALDLDSARYLILIPFQIPLLLGVAFQELRSRRVRAGASALVATAVVFNVGSTVDYYFEQPQGANRVNLQIIDTARLHGLSKGYAGYWNSNINTYLANDEVDFIQVRCVGPTPEPYDWLTDDGIRVKRASRTFLLWEDDDHRSGCEYDSVVRHFGDPTEVVPVTAEKRLLLYDYDLIRRM